MFSKSCQYAIRAVVYLAKYSSEGHKIGATEIAERLNVPRHFLAKLLQRMSKQRLISSSKGPQGGFYLEEKDIQNKLIDIVVCFDGPGHFSNCVLGLKKCGLENPCAIHHDILPYRDALESILTEKTIDNFKIITETKP